MEMDASNLLHKAMLTCLVLLGLTSLFAQFAGGSGTLANPYLISNPTHLNNVRNYLDCSFKLISNIDLGVSPYNQGEGWSPLGGVWPPFTGNFDGNGFTISNLFINRTSVQEQALFGYASNALIKNVNLLNINMTSGNISGGLMGACDYSIIDNCTIAGTITSNISYTGGLAGSCSYSQISRCSSNVNINGIDTIGGLIGESYHSSISCSRSSGAVISVSGIAGGLVGSNTYGTIIYCYATGSVYTESFNNAFGGLVDMNIHSSAIYDCYSTGSVSGGHLVGGLVGTTSSGEINRCFSIGHVQGTTTGGLIGIIGDLDPSTVNSSYWNTQTSGQTSSAGGLGLTTSAMTYPYVPNTYTGWEMDSTWCADVNHDINGGYPYLQIQNSPGMVLCPEFSHETGAYAAPINVDIICYTPDSIIYYTTDGSEPSDSSFVYTNSITVSDTTEIKARAYKQGWVPSIIAYVEYYIEPVSIDDQANVAKSTLQNYPNPFNPATTICFALKKICKTNLCIFNIKGQLVKTLLNAELSVGKHSIVWNGTDDKGKQVSSGLYFSRMESEGKVQTRKMMMVK